MRLGPSAPHSRAFWSFRSHAGPDVSSGSSLGRLTGRAGGERDRPAGWSLTRSDTSSRRYRTGRTAPKQGNEGAPESWLVFDARVAAGLDGLTAGDDLFVLTWLHESRRNVLRVHPRERSLEPGAGGVHDPLPGAPEPDRAPPGPVLQIDGLHVQVSSLEAIDGTPIVDVKPVIDADRD